MGSRASLFQPHASAAAVLGDELDASGFKGALYHVKRNYSNLMPLKSYQIDGRMLRSGLANFSAS